MHPAPFSVFLKGQKKDSKLAAAAAASSHMMPCSSNLDEGVILFLAAKSFLAIFFTKVLGSFVVSCLTTVVATEEMKIVTHFGKQVAC